MSSIVLAFPNEKLSRRAFARLGTKAAMASLVFSSFFLAGCSVFDEILRYVGVGLQAFQGVIDLLAGVGALPLGTGTLIDTAVALVKAGFADLQTAVKNYETAPDASKATLLGKVSTVISVLAGSITSFWNDVKIPDPKIASTAQGLLEIVLSTLAGFQTQLPLPAATGAQARTYMLAGRPIKAVRRTAKQFKTDYNAVLATNGYPQYALR